MHNMRFCIGELIRMEKFAHFPYHGNVYPVRFGFLPFLVFPSHSFTFPRSFLYSLSLFFLLFTASAAMFPVRTIRKKESRITYSILHIFLGQLGFSSRGVGRRGATTYRYDNVSHGFIMFS